MRRIAKKLVHGAVARIAVATACALAVSLGEPDDAPAATSELSPTHWGVVVGSPQASKVKVVRDVTYLRDERDTLAIDVYLPPGHKAGATHATVVFLNAIGDADGQEKVKRWGIYQSWPRLVATYGMTGISMDAARERVPESLEAVFAFLEREGARHGVDPARIGVYAASANVTQASAYLLSPEAARGIRAAVLYYGQPPAARPRTDLPVLFVAAESDVSPADTAMAGLWRRVIQAQAPWRLVFASDLPHAFDAFQDDEPSRRLVRETIDFWRANLESAPPSADPPSVAREILAAQYAHDPAKAEPLLAKWTAEHPRDVEAALQRGRMLSQLQRGPEALAEYERAYALEPTNLRVVAGLGMAYNGAQQWAKAAELLERAIAGGVDNSQLRGALAWTLLNMNRNQDAVRHYERAFELGIPPGPNTQGAARYNLACGYARLGRKDDALAALALAADQGFGTRAGYEGDDDLKSLRGDARWNQVLAKLDARAAAGP